MGEGLSGISRGVVSRGVFVSLNARQSPDLIFVSRRVERAVTLRLMNSIIPPILSFSLSNSSPVIKPVPFFPPWACPMYMMVW